jgi:hypothetical protein
MVFSSALATAVASSHQHQVESLLMKKKLAFALQNAIESCL